MCRLNRGLSRFFVNVLALLMCLAMLPEAEAYQSRDHYRYPYSNPYLASITSQFLRAYKVKPKILKLEPLPGREHVPLLDDEVMRISMSVFAQNQPAPLVFIIPGYGGSAHGGQSNFIAENLVELGLSVIVLPSPSDWGFVAGQSSVPVPGFVPEEAKDLYRVMKESAALASQRLRLQPTSFSVVGYSMGAQHAGFLALLDGRRRELNFQRVLLINPPQDLGYALAKLDHMHHESSFWSLKKKQMIWGHVISKGPELRDYVHEDPTAIMRLDRYIDLNTSHIKFLVSDIFRRTLRDSIYASQQVNDIGFLKTSISKYRRNARLAEISSYNFTEYAKAVVWPYWSELLGVRWASYSDFVNEGSLLPVAEQLGALGNVYYMHNRDDFCVRPMDIERMAEAMGDRAFVYPRGGHIGNVWHRQNIIDLKSIFSGLN